ncbi:MAG: hypothetical protein ABSE90_03130 [Verrucomicrobiota bacterium]
MNPKQLANVLIKILGLSICVHGFPASILAAIGIGEALIHAMQNGHSTGSPFPYWTYSMTYLIQSAIEFAAGIFLIVRSRWVTDILFKDEAE